MNHKLDITNYHETMLHFQEFIGLNVFIQFPVITEQLPSSYEINLENIAVNFYSDEPAYKNILLNNPNNFIKDYKDPVILLKKSKLVINNTKCAQILMVSKVKNKDYFHSWDTQFSKGDFQIVCYGKSLAYPDTMTFVCVIYTGSVELLFDESDMLLHTIGTGILFSQKEIEAINAKQAEKIIAYRNNIEDLNINNRYSRLWDPDYDQQFFSSTDEYPYCKFAIKDYDGSNNQ